MTKDRIGIVIQARLTSSRFWGKSLAPLLGRPIIEWVIKRALKVSPEILVIVVIPDNEENEELYYYLNNLDVHVIRGSENNVASRFVEAIKKFQLEHVIRVCADNPLLSPMCIRELIDFYFNNGQKYSFNHVPKFGIKINDGFGAEMFNASLFLNDYSSFKLDEEFEHVTYRYAENCTVADFAFKEWMKGDLKLDVDTKEDLSNLEDLLNRTEIPLDRIFEENNEEYFLQLKRELIKLS